MKKKITAFLAFILLFTPIYSLNISANDEELSEDLKMYIRYHEGEDPDADLPFLELAKDIDTVEPITRSESSEGQFYVFDYKGLEHFTSLRYLTVGIDMGGRSQIKNFTKIPDSFKGDSREIEIVGTLWSNVKNAYDGYENVLDDSGSITWDSVATYQNNLKNELISLSNQYSQTQIRKTITLDMLDAFLPNFAFLDGLSYYANFQVEAEDPDRYEGVEMQEVEYNGKTYYDATIKDIVPPISINDSSETFEISPSEKTSVGINGYTLSEYLSTFDEVDILVTATLEDGRSFSASREYLEDLDDQPIDDTKAFFTLANEMDEGIRGRIESINVKIEKTRSVNEILAEQKDRYMTFTQNPVEDTYELTNFGDIYSDGGIPVLGYAVYKEFGEDEERLIEDFNVIIHNYAFYTDLETFTVTFDSMGGTTVDAILGRYG